MPFWVNMKISFRLPEMPVVAGCVVEVVLTKSGSISNEVVRLLLSIRHL